MTIYCARIRFFGVLRNFLVSVFAEITFAIWWKLTIFRLILDKRWKWLYNLIIDYLLLLAHFGTYKYSLFLGHHATIYEISNPAFGGRGPGFYKKRTTGTTAYEFDSTRGFPGEGWSNNYPLFKLATWNCRSLTYERVQYCRALGYDVLALTELWHNQTKFQSKDKSFVIAEPKIIKKGKRKGKVRFPKDKAAGVAIMLSKRAQDKV